MIEIKLDGKKVTMREPKVSDLMMLDSIEGEMAKEAALVSSLCELPLDEVSGLAYSKYKPFKKAVTAFLA